MNKRLYTITLVVLMLVAFLAAGVHATWAFLRNVDTGNEQEINAAKFKFTADMYNEENAQKEDFTLNFKAPTQINFPEVKKPTSYDTVLNRSSGTLTFNAADAAATGITAGTYDFADALAAGTTALGKYAQSINDFHLYGDDTNFDTYAIPIVVDIENAGQVDMIFGIEVTCEYKDKTTDTTWIAADFIKYYIFSNFADKDEDGTGTNLATTSDALLASTSTDKYRLALHTACDTESAGAATDILDISDARRAAALKDAADDLKKIVIAPPAAAGQTGGKIAVAVVLWLDIYGYEAAFKDETTFTEKPVKVTITVKADQAYGGRE